MRGRRTAFEIYWEILVFCRTPQSFTGIINRCDLNSKTGQEYLRFLVEKGYIVEVVEEDKTRYVATERAGEYTALFSSLYRKLFDAPPRFKL
ncbi:MAG: winged helix-turn-helix domain-containing protein [Methanoculleus horonobensis]|jgi:predicted transcriptional regulator|nr:winged helix-turn-helix domain-containing protein [Methanoculleus horonobensis]